MNGRRRPIPLRSSLEGDAELLARIADGDATAMGMLYDAHGAALLRFAIRLAGEADADDVVHDTFLRVSTLAARFDSKAASARPWLFGIAVRVAQERRRAIRRFFDAVGRLTHQSDARFVPPRDQASDVARALARLPTAKRTVLLLVDVEGFSCQEAADALAIPIGTVWTRLHHARKAFRAAWEEDR